MKDHDEIQGKGVYAPEVLEFVRSANNYCSWLEEASEMKPTDFISASLRLLSGVYQSAVAVERTEPMLETGNERFVTEQDWSGIYQAVLQLLGRHNAYLRIADGEEYDRSDLVSHNISEDLADIYQDLKDFTLQYRQGIEEIMNDAVFEVMDNFDNFWSEKLLHALQALNKLFISRTDPLEEMENPVDPAEDEDVPKYDNSFFTRLQDQNEEDI